MAKYTGVIPCAQCGLVEEIFLRGRRLCARCRLLRHVIKPNDPDACWAWSGAKRFGYGVFRHEGRAQAAHRVSYAVHTGPIPDGLVIDHICRNRECVNPKHLRAITQGENLQNHPGTARSNSRSGARGVIRNTGRPGWIARVKVDGVVHNSYHKTLAEAAEAARLMRLKYHTHNEADQSI